MFGGQSSLTEGDVEAIRRDAPAVAYITPTVRSSGQVVAAEMNWPTQVQGVDVDWPFIRAWNTTEGSFFTDQDVRSGAKVAVLGAVVAGNLFPGGNAVGWTTHR